MTTYGLTVRLDEDAERALRVLTADGRTRTEAVRAALLEAERSAMRAWAEQVRNDPDDVAESRAILADMDDDRAW
ncbi:MAG: hypothetical protein ACT4QG_20475 [Sporichthyaceae bacterium]